jgi:hypothetical protein
MGKWFRTNVLELLQEKREMEGKPTDGKRLWRYCHTQSVNPCNFSETCTTINEWYKDVRDTREEFKLRLS